MPSLISVLLKQSGPVLSSVLCDQLCEHGKLTRETARKQISRSVMSGAINSLKGLFPHREAFLYLPTQFGSDQYWKNLTESLQSTHSAYGFAIGALLGRGGILPARHFASASGAPTYMSKRLSHDAVLEGLTRYGLVNLFSVAGEEDFIALREKSTERFSAAYQHVKSRIITESLLLKGVAQWIKTLGFGSYDKLRIRDLTIGAVPAVSGFPFDLSAPSYLSPLLQLKNSQQLIPGFIACDVLLNGRLELQHIAPFINKCRSINSLPNNGRCLFMFVADEYSQAAFGALKKEGVVAATTNNLFGQEVAEALRMLGDMLAWLSFTSDGVREIDTIMTRLSHIEGAASQLQGDLFEYVVAQALRTGAPHVRVGVQCKSDSGKLADCDVLVEQGLSKITYVECKGYRPYSEVLHQDVKHWISHQVPVFYKHALQHHQQADIHMEFWTTGKLSAESKESLRKFMINNQERKRYTITIREAHDVQKVISETRDQSLIKVFRKHFMDNFRKEPLDSRSSPWRLASGIDLSDDEL